MDFAHLRLLVTGGIGSGKSAVAHFFGRHGFELIDADQLGHRVLEPDGAAYQKVVERWPQVVAGGRIDRSQLASIVFSDPDELAALEAITHPPIRQLLEEEISKRGAPLVVELSVPKLIDPTGWVVVVVDAPESLRLQRLEARGMPTSDAKRRMKAQLARNQWLALADLVFDNSGEFVDVGELVDRAVAGLNAISR